MEGIEFDLSDAAKEQRIQYEEEMVKIRAAQYKAKLEKQKQLEADLIKRRDEWT